MKCSHLPAPLLSILYVRLDYLSNVKTAPVLPAQGRQIARLATNESCTHNQYGSLNKTTAPKNTIVRS
nr:MAG TPA: hypothetical protein [Caudoviricetes sp.]